MRILILHSRYLSGTVSGENRVVEDEARLLSDAGHDVRVWQADPENAHGAQLLRVGVDAIWSTSAVAKVQELLDESRPDVVHCHNLFPALSPAVLRTCNARSIPVLATLHSYRLLCPAGTLLRQGKICEDCVGKVPWRAVVHKCHRNSALASGAIASSIALHRTMGTFDSAVTLYLAVSKFMREKHVAAGYPPERMTVKSNFAWPQEVRRGPGDYFLFLGRLAEEKGVATLLEAWRDVPAKLLVVGDGPQAADLRTAAPSSVEFTGPVPGEDVPSILRGARALVVPSRWYEGQPRGILEAFAAGVPVIASRIGGLPELIEDGFNGLLRDFDDPQDWAKAAQLLSDDGMAEEMGGAAHRTWIERYTPERGLEALEAAYRAGIALFASG